MASYLTNRHLSGIDLNREANKCLFPKCQTLALILRNNITIKRRFYVSTKCARCVIVQLLCFSKCSGGFWWEPWKEMAEWLFARCQTGGGEEWGGTRWRIRGNFNRSRWKICGYLSLFPPNSHQRLHMLVHAHWSAADQLRYTHWLHIRRLPAGQGAVLGSRYHARGGGVRPLPCVGAIELLSPALLQASSSLYPLPAGVCWQAAETLPLPC